MDNHSVPGDSMLFVLNSLAVGGSETKIIRVANALAHQGVRIELAYLKPPESLRDKIDPAVAVTHLHRRGKYSPSALRRLRNLVYCEPHAVVAVNLYPLLYVVPAVRWGKIPSVRVVGFVNTSEPMDKEWRIRTLYAPFLRRCDQIVFGCKAQQALWVEKYGLSIERSHVIYNGVDHQFFSPTSKGSEGDLLRRSLGIPGTAMVIGSVGRLAPEKNFDVMINSLARLNAAGRETYAILVGHGGEREKLERVAKAEGVSEKLKFLGALNDVRTALSVMDIFILPSRAVETFSNAALEAMAMARTVVISQMGGAAEMVDHGVSGMLFQVGNIDALTEILKSLHDAPEMRKALGAAARERVVDSFKFTDMVEAYKLLLPHSH